MTNRRIFFVVAVMLAVACEGLSGCDDGGSDGGSPGTAGAPATSGTTGGAASIGTTSTAAHFGTGGAATASGSSGTSGSGGTGGTASPPGGPGGATTGTGGHAGALAVTWTLPALITDDRGSTFPTYLAHLLGRKIDHPFPTDLACATVMNGGSGSATVHLTVDFAVYASPKKQDVTVAAKGSTRVCLTPTFDLKTLYALTAPVTGMIEGQGRDDANGDVGSVNRVVSVPAVTDIAWEDAQIKGPDMNTLTAVYVEPNAPVVDQLQRLAQKNSVFSNFGDGNAYARQPYPRKGTLEADEYVNELLYLEKDEPLEWVLGDVACAGCGKPAVDVYVMTLDQFDAWDNGTSNAATAVWSDQPKGTDRTKSLAPGFYEFVVMNTDETSSRDVVWSRTVTREDVVRDLLTSVFSALRSLGITYTNITGTYFQGWQHVRRVGQSVSALSANCLDGTLVFASVAELLGLQPVLIFKTGHAYMGIRSAPGSSVIWPIETTMVGDASKTPLDAYVTGIEERADDSRKDPEYQEMDVASLHARGITPLVAQ